MASGVGGLRASLIAAGRGGHNVRRPERKTAPKPSREAVNPLGRGDMDLTFGCVLSQAAYGPMAGPTAIRTLAQRAETLGFHTIWFADHIVIPRHVKPFEPFPDYALSSAIKVWYKTGTCGCFCGFERWRATRCNFKRGSARPSLPFFMEQRISAGRR